MLEVSKLKPAAPASAAFAGYSLLPRYPAAQTLGCVYTNNLCLRIVANLLKLLLHDNVTINHVNVCLLNIFSARGPAWALSHEHRVDS